MPYAFALYAYRHLQELDYRTNWVARMQGINAAQLMAVAFHKPEALAAEYRAGLAAAGREQTPEDLLAYGRKLAADLDRKGILNDG